MTKNRQLRIMELVNERDIETQEELANILKNEGFDVTQATVSRDIRKLHLTKITMADGRQKYGTMSEEKGPSEKHLMVLKHAFVSIDCAQNLVVLKTVSGMAMAAAAALDSMHMPGYMGCIAGDDTIMIAARSNEDAERIVVSVKEIVY